MPIPPVDTANKFFVACQGKTLVLLSPLPRVLSADDALNLAAYLVSLSIACEPTHPWETVLEAVQST